MTDFPTMVAALVSAYFTARVVWDGRDVELDALAAGVAAGVAIGFKPSTALFLAGPALAMLAVRRFRGLVWMGVALLPSVIVLAVWKYRGYGYLPLIHSGLGEPVRHAAASVPVALHLPDYVSFDWSQFERQLDLLREHFWSGRVVEWLIVAGLIAVGRRSLPALGLVGGWFVAFALAKGGYGQFSIEDSSLLRVLIPVIPAFVLLLAALPYLVPRSGRPWPAVDPGPRVSRRVRIGGIAATLVVTALVPLAAIAAASPVQGDRPDALVVQQPLIPASVDLGLTARRDGGGVSLAWSPVHSAGGAVFYHVYRADAATGSLDCDHSVPALLCQLKAVDLGATKSPVFHDSPPAGNWEYRVGVSANWLDDPTLGDVYELTRPARPR
jgi:hypothetical protein